MIFAKFKTGRYYFTFIILHFVVVLDTNNFLNVTWGGGSEKCQKKFHVLFEWPLMTYNFLAGSKNVYFGKETFLPSGFAFPVSKGSYLKDEINKW